MICWNGEEFQARRRLYELKNVTPVIIKVVNMGNE